MYGGELFRASRRIDRNAHPMTWIFDLALSLALPLGAFAMSPLVTAFLGPNEKRSSALAAATSLAVFLAWLQAGGMLLGFVGLLRGGIAAGWIVAGPLLGVAYGVARRERPCRPSLALGWPLALGLAGIAILYLLQSTVPPWYRDSMVYHLALPRFFATAGGFETPDDNVFASFPLGWESILALLHSLGGAPDHDPPFNPRLVGTWTVLGTALATMALAETAGARRTVAGWAAFLFLLVPTVYEFGTSAYVEAWLVLLSTLALTFALRAQTHDRRFQWAAAVTAGLAVSVKFPGVAVVLVIGLLYLTSGLRQTPERSAEAVRAALRFMVIAGLVGAPFYVRNWFERGNPIFPLAFDTFGGKGWDSWRDVAYGVTLSHYGVGRDSVDYLLLPFRLFTTRDMRMGFEGSLGPVVGLGLVSFFLLRRRSRRGTPAIAGGGPGAVSWLGIFAIAWFVFWATSVQQVRFFLVAVPPLLGLLAAGVEALAGGWRRVSAAALTVVALLWFAPPAHALWSRQETGAWLAGRATKEEILSKLLPDSYPPLRELEAFVPEDGKVWLVWMRGYTYYLRRPYRLDSVFEAYRLEALLDHRSETALSELRSEGITHLLVHGSFFLVDGNADLSPGRTARIKERFEDLIRSGSLRSEKSWGPVTLYEVVPE